MRVPNPLPLLAVPNVSEGRDDASLDAIAAAFTAPTGATTAAATLLDRHADADHHRAVLTLAAGSGGRADTALADALLAGAREAIARIDVMADLGLGRPGGDSGGGGSRSAPPRGEHPHVGALDVMPIVYLHPSARGPACALALLVADRIGDELQVPVFLYGALAAGRTRAQLRTGGTRGLQARMATGEQRPDFGPGALHPTAGATLVAAREPLVAFNLELSPPATHADAKRIATLIREGGAEGLPGLRAIGVQLRAASDAPAAQVSMNIERPHELPLRMAIEAVRRHAHVAAGELVGLAPRAAFRDFPEDLAMPTLDPARQVIENVLTSTHPPRAAGRGPASRAPRISG